MLPTIGSYLLDELYQHGVHHIFGIPGDYVLKFDKAIEEHPISFINATQEINAGYMADAYARLKGLGAVVITYGVGLGALNAIAGSFVEDVPVVAISGTPGLEEVRKNTRRHHLLGKLSEGESSQNNLFKELTAYQGLLFDAKNAEEQIGEAIFTAINKKKPVYLELPRNLVGAPLAACSKSMRKSFAPVDKKIEKIIEKDLEHFFSKVKKPLLWLGHEILRWGLSQEILRFATRFGIPIITSLLGKSAIDEHNPLFAGVYLGNMSEKHLQRYVEESDGCLMLGVLCSDLDTGCFSAKTLFTHTIQANSGRILLNNKEYSFSLPHLAKVLNALEIKNFFNREMPKKLPEKKLPQNTTTRGLFQELNHFLTYEHVVVTDVGDCLFGSSDLIVGQEGFMSTSFFAALGYGIPAAIGAAFARPDKRIVAIVGDGGFQMTGIELATAVRYGLDPIVILLNNHGYGTERPLLEGRYNDLVNWNYTMLPSLLGKGKAVRVKKSRELKTALKKAFSTRGEFFLIEVELEKTDFSPALRRFASMAGAG